MKSKFYLLSVFVFLVLGFQNCSNPTKYSVLEEQQAPESSQVTRQGNGHGYDGKIYSHTNRRRVCKDSTHHVDQVLVQKSQEAYLIKSNCKKIDPQAIDPNEVVIEDEKLTYKGVEFQVDHCESTTNPTPGAECVSGAIYAGEFNYGGAINARRLMVTPGNCAHSVNPVCDGNIDRLQLAWGLYGTFAGLEDEKEGAYFTQILVEDYGGVPAAEFCYDLQYAGYSDWYLPAVDELNFMLHQSEMGLLSGFQPRPNLYWSSTEGEATRAVYRHSQMKGEIDKREKLYVRCVRAYDPGS